MEEGSNPELHLLVPSHERTLEFGAEENHEQICWRSKFLDEAHTQLWLAGPLIVVSLLQYSLQVISIMFIGHLGELSLSSASIATSFASVTGFNLLLGMGSALETLCGQAYGAKQDHMLGVHMQRAMLCLSIASIPLATLWSYTAQILIAVGQNPEISTGAGVFIQWMIPSLFAYGLLQCIIRFLQTQNIVFPMVITSGVTVLVHIPLCWILVFKSGLGQRGAALANTISYWINVILLMLYVKFSPGCKTTWTGFSKQALYDVPNFLKLAIPSAIMICLEYWAFEMVVLLSGLLPNPKLETSVLSIRYPIILLLGPSALATKLLITVASVQLNWSCSCLNSCWLVYTISVGLGGAVSTRVSNELGAGKPRNARLALHVMTIIALTEGITVATITVLARQAWGKLYSNETEVVDYTATMLPLLALSNFLDGIQCVLSGAARGCGWQNVCSVINLGAYYGVGIPSAVLLAFVFHIGGQGLWMGIICALSVQLLMLVIINLHTNWDDEARKAMARISGFNFSNSIPLEN